MLPGDRNSLAYRPEKNKFEQQYKHGKFQKVRENECYTSSGKRTITDWKESGCGAHFLKEVKN